MTRLQANAMLSRLYNSNRHLWCGHVWRLSSSQMDVLRWWIRSQRRSAAETLVRDEPPSVWRAHWLAVYALVYAVGSGDLEFDAIVTRFNALLRSPTDEVRFKSHRGPGAWRRSAMSALGELLGMELVVCRHCGLDEGDRGSKWDSLDLCTTCRERIDADRLWRRKRGAQARSIRNRRLAA